MKLIVLILAGLALTQAACVSVTVKDTHPASPASLSEQAKIISVLDQQSAAWNRGDIHAFMEGYWKSDELRFASGGSITYGWQATLDRYLSRYDSAAKMGELSFTDLMVTPTGPDDAMVFGHWALQREADRPSGLFTLHFRRIDGAWVIVSDHTSSAD